MNDNRAILAALAAVLFAVGLAGCDATEASGDACESTADCSAGELCDDADKKCVCPPEGCGANNGDGITRFGFSGDGSVSLADLGTVQVTGDGSDPLVVAVPSGARSVAVVVEGAGSNIILAHKITSPSGDVVFDYNNDVNTNRTDPNDGLYIVLIPSNPDVELAAGDWKLEFLTDGPDFSATVTGVFKTAASSSKKIDVNLFFVGVDGLDAAKAEADPGFQAILSNVSDVFGAAGIGFGQMSYIDITGDDADRLGIVDSVDGPSSELAQLFKLSADRSNRALNFFFVADIGGGDAGFSLLGLAGGVPGPPSLHGTGRSGIAINMADFIGAEGDALATVSADLELIMAHEAGHYMGLYHTTERNGLALDDGGILGQDPLSDTPLCPDSADTSGNMVLSADECADHGGGNLMFWSPKTNGRALTSKQGSVINASAVIK